MCMDIAGNQIGRKALIAAMVAAAAITTGSAFAGWLDHGTGIFLSYASSGLAWCF